MGENIHSARIAHDDQKTPSGAKYGKQKDRVMNAVFLMVGPAGLEPATNGL
jgi:hypothetical protein